MHPKGSSGGGSCRCEGTEQLRNKLQTAHRTLIVDMEGVRVHDKRMNDCLPPILFSAIFKLLKVLPDTELDAC